MEMQSEYCYRSVRKGAEGEYDGYVTLKDRISEERRAGIYCYTLAFVFAMVAFILEDNAIPHASHLCLHGLSSSDIL